ncbi:MAG TPA: FAD-binding oxidoreductase [Candidatus Acidoferrales bacterium]
MAIARSTLGDAVITRLERLVAPHNVCTEEHMVRPYVVDGMAPAALVLPESDDDVAAVVRVAVEEKLGVIPVGHGSKLAMGMPPARYDIALGLFHLNRVVAYDPDDLTLSVEPGIPLARLAQQLAQHKQWLPLAVPFTTQTTVGGAIASGIDSPLRQGYGTARDYVLGVEYVSGLGELAKSGGRVVKNVSGYDLHKAFIGSLGTLGVITRVNFRTFPVLAAVRGFIASFPTAEAALALQRRIVATSLQPVTLEVISPELARIFAAGTPRHLGEDVDEPGEWFSTSAWTVAAGFGGNPAIIERHARDLTRLATEAGGGGLRVLDDTERPTVWGRLRECLAMLLEASPAAVIVKASAPPAKSPELIAKLYAAAQEQGLPAAALVRAVGVTYFALLPTDWNDDVATRLAAACDRAFDAAGQCGGHAVIPFCPTMLKQRIRVGGSVWGPPREDAPLMRKLKGVFDPHGIFSPGRLVGGI